MIGNFQGSQKPLIRDVDVLLQEGFQFAAVSVIHPVSEQKTPNCSVILTDCKLVQVQSSPKS